MDLWYCFNTVVGRPAMHGKGPVKYWESRGFSSLGGCVVSNWADDERQTVTGVLATASRKWPDRNFLGDAGLKYSFADVERETNRLAQGLRALGVRRGDTVCTMLDPSADAIMIWFAINKLGAISAPVNTSYKGEYLRHQIADCGAALVIAESVYLGRIADLAGNLPCVRRAIHRGDAPAPGIPWPTASFGTLRAENAGPVGEDIAHTDIAMLIYTSGTTGPSKGCMISHNYACHFASVQTGAHGMRAGDIVWMPLPIFHLVATCGLTLAALIQGATVELLPRFSVSSFWPEIERTKANFVLAMGSMLTLIANAPESDAQKRCFGQIRTVCGAPFEQHLQETWQRRFGVQITGSPGYGQTEMCIVTRHRLGDPQPEGSSGKRFEDYDVRIVDDAGNECPPGVPGEIIMRPLKANIMFDGYWNRPAETLRVLKDLWLHSGDIGKFDEEGYFYFVDRKKDYLRKGGENVSSTEMEAVFLSHEDIAAVAIHAVPSALAEDDIKATIILKVGAKLDARALCLWAIDRIPAFAVPRYIEFRDTLPTTPTGKLMKFKLREEGVTSATWDREASDLAVRPSNRGR